MQFKIETQHVEGLWGFWVWKRDHKGAWTIVKSGITGSSLEADALARQAIREAKHD